MNLIGRIEKAEKVCKALGLTLKILINYSNGHSKEVAISGYLGPTGNGRWTVFEAGGDLCEALAKVTAEAREAGMAALEIQRTVIGESVQAVAGKISALEDI